MVGCPLILAVLLWLAGCGSGYTMRPLAGSGGGQPAALPAVGADPSCGRESLAALMACVQPERIAADVATIALPRPPGSAQHRAVQRLCADRLRSLGFEVKPEPYGTGTNVVAVKPGFSKSAEQVLVSAHYDGVARCEAADDNASGVAVLLEVARVLATARLDRSLVVACWDEGERGQLGSAAYAKQARARGELLRAAVALEAVGYASSEPGSQKMPDRFDEAFPDEALALLDGKSRGDFLMVVAESATEQAAKLMVDRGELLGLPVHVLSLTERQKVKIDAAHRSDQVSFWQQRYPALLLTDTGRFRNPRFRCGLGQDAADTLDHRFMAQVAQITAAVMAELLALR